MDQILGKNQAVRAILAASYAREIEQERKPLTMRFKHYMNYSLLYALIAGVFFFSMIAYAVIAGMNQ